MKPTVSKNHWDIGMYFIIAGSTIALFIQQYYLVSGYKEMPIGKELLLPLVLILIGSGIAIYYRRKQ